MKIYLLSAILFVLACKTAENSSKNQADAKLTPPESTITNTDASTTEIPPPPVTFVEKTVPEIEKVNPPKIKTVPEIKSTPDSVLKIAVPEIKKNEAVLQKPDEKEKMVQREVEKTVPLPPPAVKIVPKTEAEKPNSKVANEVLENLLKVKGYKKLFKYDKTPDNKNYIYASKYTNIEVDGQTQIKIKLNSSDLFINLPISRKLKSGKFTVSAIVTINKKTAKLEFNIVSGKKEVDFTLSSNSLKQF